MKKLFPIRPIPITPIRCRPGFWRGFEHRFNVIGLGDLGTANDLLTPRPDTIVMLAPGSDLKDNQDDADSARPSVRHSNQCDLNFLDGHVESMRLNQFYSGQTPEDKWFDQDAVD